nr:MAG: 2-oxoglutarate dehydrogenase complex dihydrolipoyllysine-residue succinyltransferase [Hyphomicrobiales bacterium]
MSIEIKVPAMGESVSEATIGRWLKAKGDAVQLDEPVVELETDKVAIEVTSPSAGMLEDILVGEGETVKVGAILGAVSEGGTGNAPSKPSAKVETTKAEKAKITAEPKSEKKPAATPAATKAKPAPSPPPSVRRIAQEDNLDISEIEGSGKRGQITKGDALAALEARGKERPAAAAQLDQESDYGAREERVPMTRLRKTIALRLKESQEVAAQLTTFNEVDMSKIMALRAAHKDAFEKKHGVKLGFMGFFVKACVAALKEIPAVNAEIDGDDIVYKNYYNIGVAVSTERGLMVPVVRDADTLSIAAIESAIADFGARARDGKLKLDDLMGGTFSLSNGGVFGSLMSTPILNAPQSGILGMHKIQNRPVAIGDKIEIRPMMYLALTYDHRLVDGREAVTFLVRVKDNLEDPQRLLLDL